MLAVETLNLGADRREAVRLLRAAQDLLENEGLHLLAAQVETVIGFVPGWPVAVGVVDPSN